MDILAMCGRQLSLLDNMVDKIAQHQPNAFEYRLSSDMFSLAVQVRISCNFALRIGHRMTGQADSNFDQPTLSVLALKRQIALTQSRLQELTHLPFCDANHAVSDKAGLVSIEMPLNQYLAEFALPNFFFHLSMVYACAKSADVPMTKGDFDGLHQYPAGFSFED